MKPIQERIHLYKDNKLVTFASLTKEEKEEVSVTLLTRAADRIMGAQGYKRVGEAHRKGD